MSNIVRRVRCFSCKKLVLPKFNKSSPNEPYLVIPLSVNNKRGCVCANCIEKYSKEDSYEFDFTSPAPSRPPYSMKVPQVSDSTEFVKRIESPPPPYITDANHKVESEKSFAQNLNKPNNDELTLIKKKYACLEYTLDSLVALVEKKVHGQHEFVEKLLYVLYYNQMANLYEDITDEYIYHKHLLMIGNTGVGKTFLTTTATKVFGVIHSLSNATPITCSSYIGDKVENVVERLYELANGDMEIAANGIIILDEIDKKKGAGGDASGRDASGEAVQQELLKLLEPSTIWIKKNTVPFKTDNLTVILLGAFVGLEDIIKKRLGAKVIGYRSTEIPEITSETIIPEDLFNYGFIPEFVGRIPKIFLLNNLTTEILEDIIYDILNRYDKFFKMKEITFSFDPALVQKIAELSSRSKTNARDLELKIGNIIDPILFRVFQSPPGGICEVHEDGSAELVLNSEKKDYYSFESHSLYEESDD